MWYNVFSSKASQFALTGYSFGAAFIESRWQVDRAVGIQPLENHMNVIIGSRTARFARSFLA